MGQKQKTEKKEEEEEEEKERERLNDGNNNGQATHGAHKPPGPKIISKSSERVSGKSKCRFSTLCLQAHSYSPIWKFFPISYNYIM